MKLASDVPKIRPCGLTQLQHSQRTCLHNNLQRGKVQRDDSQPKQIDRRHTIKILSIELLYKLQHHPVGRTEPHSVSQREAFEPGCLSSLVLSLDGEIELFDNLDDQGAVFGHTVQLGNDASCFVAPSSSKQMTAGEPPCQEISRSVKRLTVTLVGKICQRAVSVPKPSADQSECAMSQNCRGYDYQARTNNSRRS